MKFGIDNLKSKVKKLLKRQDKMLKKYGYFGHYIEPADDKDYCNYHTHGLMKSNNHYDFQIVIPIPVEIASRIFDSLIENVKKGVVYTEGKYRLTVVDRTLDIILVKKMDMMNHEVLRIILPDEKFLFAPDPNCDPYYAYQDQVDTSHPELSTPEKSDVLDEDTSEIIDIGEF